MPRPGWDEGHHGVDFAYWSRPGHPSMVGLHILSVLSGRVAAVLPNRQPYGNAVIIETSLSGLPSAWRDVLLPALQSTPAPTVTPPSLHCPAANTSYGNPAERSLYLLYAHMNEPSALIPGQSVTCGQTIGAVGTTGNSVNAHLHLETRLGPAGATFSSMAHYQNDATDEEMAAYCAWRVSGLFELLNPMTLLSAQP